MGQCSVIGNQEQALCIQIQPSNRKEISPEGIFDQAYYSRITDILCGRYGPRGLFNIKYSHPGISLPAHRQGKSHPFPDLPLYLLPLRSVPIDLDPALSRKLLYLAAASLSHFCEKFIQTHLSGILFFLLCHMDFTPVFLIRRWQLHSYCKRQPG